MGLLDDLQALCTPTEHTQTNKTAINPEESVCVCDSVFLTEGLSRQKGRKLNAFDDFLVHNSDANL